MNQRKILITGTDTGVGKTFVSCCLIEELQRLGYSVCALKPLETGVTDPAQTDAAKMQAVLTSDEQVSMFQFEEAISPHMASARAKREIDILAVKKRIEELSSKADFLIVEGAGGLMVPIEGKYTFLDLCVDCDLEILPVAASKLGVINHLLLLLEAAKNKDLKTLPYVLNRVEKQVDDLAVETNKEALELASDAQCLLELGYSGSLKDRLAEIL